jgi:hypothetical protein
MKLGITFGLLLLTGIALMAKPASADIVAKEFVLPGTGKIESGLVLQGSRNMKRLGKGGTTSIITVPAFSPLSSPSISMVIPALETPEIAPKPPKPRFGYGSDYVPGAETSQASGSQATAVPLFTPIYQQPQKSSYWSFQSPWYFHPGSAYFYQPSFGYPCQPSLSYHGAFFPGGSLSFSWGSPFFGCP